MQLFYLGSHLLLRRKQLLPDLSDCPRDLILAALALRTSLRLCSCLTLLKTFLQPAGLEDSSACFLLKLRALVFWDKP